MKSWMLPFNSLSTNTLTLLFYVKLTLILKHLNERRCLGYAIFWKSCDFVSGCKLMKTWILPFNSHSANTPKIPHKCWLFIEIFYIPIFFKCIFIKEEIGVEITEPFRNKFTLFLSSVYWILRVFLCYYCLFFPSPALNKCLWVNEKSPVWSRHLKQSL